MKKRNYFILAIIFLVSSLFAVETSADLHLKIMGTRTASAPHIFEGSIFFTQKPAQPVRYVGIDFAHENFREVHLFQRNEKGVLFFLYPVPEKLRYIDYRIIIDGLWSTDPVNPLIFRDSAGIAISRFEFPPSATEERVKSPLIDPSTGSVEFNVKAPEGRNIFLAGRFNGWDPYMHPLKEVRPGLYSLRIRLLPGTYRYYFFSDGNRLLDPLNPERGADYEGYSVSILRVTR